jgi:hypothetical protein
MLLFRVKEPGSVVSFFSHNETSFDGLLLVLRLQNGECDEGRCEGDCIEMDEQESASAETR